MLLSPVILWIFSENNLVPDWYHQAPYSVPRLASILLFIIIYQYVIFKQLRLHKFSGKKTIDYNKFVLLLISFIAANQSGVDLRNLASENGFNIIYSFANLICLVFFFATYRQRTLSYPLIVLIGIYVGMNGSKSALASFVLVFMFIHLKKVTIRDILIGIFSIIVIAYFLPHYLIRYIDQGLSMLTVISICDSTGISTFSLYLEAVISKFNGSSFNPGFEFFRRSGISVGYNVTPTVIGDIYCFSKSFVYGLITYIFIIYLLFIIPAKFLRYSLFERAFLFYISATILQSTIFDLVKFGFLTNSAIIIHMILRKIGSRTHGSIKN